MSRGEPVTTDFGAGGGVYKSNTNLKPRGNDYVKLNYTVSAHNFFISFEYMKFEK